MEEKTLNQLSTEDSDLFLDIIEVDAAASEMLCNSLGCG